MWENIAQAITIFLAKNNNPCGLLLLFFSALFEYIFPPFPGDTITLFSAILVTRYRWSLLWVFIVLLCGSGIGAMLDFAIGFWMAGPYENGRFLRREKVRAQVEIVLRAFKRHGEIYVVINRFLPAVRSVFFLAAGMARLRPLRVLIFALLSAAIWNALILMAGYAVGANWTRLYSLFTIYSTIVWCLLGLLVLAGVLIWWRRRKRARLSETIEPKSPSDNRR